MTQQVRVAQARRDLGRAIDGNDGNQECQRRHREQHDAQTQCQNDRTEQQQTANQRGSCCSAMFGKDARQICRHGVFQAQRDDIGDSIKGGQRHGIDAIFGDGQLARDNHGDQEERDKHPQAVELVQQVAGRRAFEQRASLVLASRQVVSRRFFQRLLQYIDDWLYRSVHVVAFSHRFLFFLSRMINRLAGLIDVLSVYPC